MSVEADGSAHAHVAAHYSSPSGAKTFQHSLTLAKPTDTNSKVAYLNDLRTSTKQMQEDINAFLTAKMEEDKVQAAAVGTTPKKGKSRDEEEEENYGEEKVEEN